MTVILMSGRTKTKVNTGRSARVVAAAGAALVLAAGCGGQGTGSETNGMTLGYTATMTGDFASYGLEMREGVDLAVEEINADGGIEGSQISIESADDEGKPGNGPTIAQQFCDDSSISAVLGYSFSSVALAAVPVYQQCQLAVIGSAVTSPELSGASPYFFRNVFTDAYQGAAAATFVAEEEGVNSIAILYQQDDYGQGVAGAFQQAFEETGGTVTSSQAYQLGTNNFGTLLNKATSDNPDALFIGGFYTESAKIANQAQAADMDLTLYAADGSLSPQLLEIGGDAVEGMTLYAAFDPSAEGEAASAFSDAFREKYGKEPSSWAALAYDAVYAVKEAAAASGGTSREEIADGLTRVDFEGATGTTVFNEQGDREGELTFLEVKDGTFIEVTDK